MASKKVKVKFIKSPSGSPFFLGYSIGGEGLVDIDTAKELLDGGFIEPVTPAKSRKKAVKKNTGEKRAGKELDEAAKQRAKENAEDLAKKAAEQE